MSNFLFKFILRKSHVPSKDSRGNAAMEFALLSPVFFLLFIGIFEVAFIMFLQTTLDNAVLMATRFARTGDMEAGTTPTATVQSLVSQYTYGIIDPGNLALTVTPYQSFADIPDVDQLPSGGTQDFGQSEDVVLYTVSLVWNFFTPLVGEAMAPNGTSITLNATTVILNEPY